MAQKLFPVNGSDEAIAPADIAAVTPAPGETFADAEAPYDANATRLRDFDAAAGDTIYVRVAVQGFPSQPLRLVALPLAFAVQDGGMTGTLSEADFPVVDAAGSFTIFSPLSAAELYEFAQVSVTKLADTALGSLYEIEIQLEADNSTYNQASSPDRLHAEANNWFLAFKSDTPIRATWAVGTGATTAEAQAQAQMPWLHIDQAELDWTQDAMGELPPLLPGESRERQLAVANWGTGPLELDASGLSDGFTLPSAPTLDPLTETPVALLFTAPSSSGQTEIDVDFGGNGENQDDSTTSAIPGNEHNGQITLRGRVALLDLVLVLDTSGSMGWARDGDFNPPDGERRWDYLREAVQQLVLGYRDFLNDRLEPDASFPGAGRLSVAAFPHPDGPGNAGTLYPTSGDSLLTATVVDDVDEAMLLDPSGGTPMGDGLAHAMGTNPGEFGLFTASGGEDENNTRWLLLLSDGGHNAGSVHPSAFYQDDDVADFDEKNVRVLTVAYGEEGADDVDYDLMEDLAANGYRRSLESGEAPFPPRAFQAAILDEVSDLNKALRSCLARSLGLAEPDDPRGRLDADHREATHDFVVSELDERFAVYVDWGTRDPDRLTLELVTPRCERIQESEAREHGGLEFHGAGRFKYFFVSRRFLLGENDEGGPRFGTWSLRVRLNPVYQHEREEYPPESYAYSVMSSSAVVFDTNVAAQRHVTGEPIEVYARLSRSGAPFANAGVTLTLDAPARSVSNWLALQEVDDELYRKTAENLKTGGVTNPFAIKARALQTAEQELPASTHREAIPMEEVAPGVYRAEIDETSVPGSYGMHLVATAETEAGTRIRRESTLQTRVEPRPDIARSDVGIQFDAKQRQADVRIWPRDSFGNVILFDPDSRARLTVEAKHAEVVGPVRANLDGSYSQTLKYAGRAKPAVEIALDGQIFEKRELVVPEGLRWMDTVLDFRPGLFPKGGKNPYDDPKAALGKVTGPDDSFVALGARGIIELTARRTRFKPQDLTVFVKQAERPRPYALEVKVPFGPHHGKWRGGWKHGWVRVGQSRGITQTFDLDKHAGRPVLGVRVVDLGSSLRDVKGEPVQAAGVLLQGVGFTPHRHRWPKLPGFPPFGPKLDPTRVAPSRGRRLGRVAARARHVKKRFAR